MAKAQDKTKISGKEKEKEQKHKDRKELIGRVKKVIKKSRRKLSEEKFERELLRTIGFLEQLQKTLSHSNGDSAKGNSRPQAKPALEKPKAAVPAVVKKAAKKPAAKAKR